RNGGRNGPGKRYHCGMMSKRERCGVAAIGLLLALATGCGGGGSSGGGPEEETQTECGDILCESDEFCLTHEASPLGEANESVLSCEKIPSGCEGLSFCDCEATESLWQGEIGRASGRDGRA